AGKQEVFGIRMDQVVSRGGRLLVSGREDDAADQVVETPRGRGAVSLAYASGWGVAAGSGFGGEAIEELGMRRLLALFAEIVESGHDAAAEELMPDAIDGDARGQWIGRIDEPVRQVESVELLGPRLDAGKKRGSAGGDGVAGAEE